MKRTLDPCPCSQLSCALGPSFLPPMPPAWSVPTPHPPLLGPSGQIPGLLLSWQQPAAWAPPPRFSTRPLSREVGRLAGWEWRGGGGQPQLVSHLFSKGENSKGRESCPQLLCYLSQQKWEWPRQAGEPSEGLSSCLPGESSHTRV